MNPGQILAATQLVGRLPEQHDRRLGIVAEPGSRHMAEIERSRPTMPMTGVG